MGSGSKPEPGQTRLLPLEELPMRSRRSRKQKPRHAWWAWSAADGSDGSYAPAAVTFTINPGSGSFQYLTHLTLIDTSSEISASGDQTQSFPNINKFRVKAIRGQILIQLSSVNIVSQDYMALHLGVSKVPEVLQVGGAPSANPAAIADSRRDWMWFHRTPWVFQTGLANLFTIGLQQQAQFLDVHIKSNRRVNENDSIQLSMVFAGTVAALSSYVLLVQPFLRLLVEEVV